MEITRWPRLTRQPYRRSFRTHIACLGRHGLHRHPSPACFHGARGGGRCGRGGHSLVRRPPYGWWSWKRHERLRERCGESERRYRAKFEDDLELARLRSTSVSDMVLVDTVVGHTTDVLSAGVGWAFQAAVHHSGFTCHRYASKHPCDRCSLYDISAPFVHALGGAFGPDQAKSSCCPHPTPSMAGGWRRLLEEESEHQWLTLSMFACSWPSAPLRLKPRNTSWATRS